MHREKKRLGIKTVGGNSLAKRMFPRGPLFMDSDHTRALPVSIREAGW